MYRTFLKNPHFTIILAGMFIIAGTVWFSADRSMDDAVLELLYRLRGPRPPASEFVLIYLGDEDIEAMGGWPLTRDYYGYMIHVLNEQGARVIGLDMRFDNVHPHYPEYDRLLAGFFRSSRNVCLPLVLMKTAEQKESPEKHWPENITEAERVLNQHPMFAGVAVALGFSNLGQNRSFHSVPLMMVCQDSAYFSYGLELSRVFLKGDRIDVTPSRLNIVRSDSVIRSIPVDSRANMALNHFGGIGDIASYSLLDVLQSYDRSPDSLNFKNKLVLIALTASSLPVLKTSPFSDQFPASLVHLTAAENIIHQKWLRHLSPALRGGLLLILLFLFLMPWKMGAIHRAIPLTFCVLILYMTIGFWLFVQFYLILPYSVPVMLAVLPALVYGIGAFRMSRMHSEENVLLNREIQAKKKQLEDAEIKLQEAEDRLKRELEEKKALTEKTKSLADQNRATVRKLEKHLLDMKATGSEKPSTVRKYGNIVHGPGSKMETVLSLIETLGADDIPVLILGETGTGKELVAKAIHQASPRKRAPFVAVNCGALSETLLESELFGHEKGSFTGALSRRRGRFEMASGGTIFLDEITETSQAFQSRLLRVLQDGAVERLGSEQPIRVNVRVVAATNRDIKEQVHRSNFRSDLFYRLNGFSMKLPPLRDRPGDIPVLANHFINRYSDGENIRISEEAMQRIGDYSWPGNVREMENTIRRAVLLARSRSSGLIRLNDLPEEIRKETAYSDLSLAYQPVENQILELLRALKFSRSAIGETARALGNRDRGTVTEYFRGICFKTLAGCEFDVGQAARQVAGADDDRVIQAVKKKIREYLKNLRPFIPGDGDPVSDEDEMPLPYRGLPKKFHPFLKEVICHLSKNK